MKKFSVLLIVELVAIWGSVILGLALHSRIPMPVAAAVPIGLLLWIGGFAYTLHRRQSIQKRRETGAISMQRSRGYPMLEARAAMHFGVAIGFRSWPTLGVAAAATILNLGTAIAFRKKIKKRFEHRRLGL
jgi:hypothetical protein